MNFGVTRLRLMRVTRPFIERMPGPFYRVALLAGWVAWTFREDIRENVIRNLTPLCDGDRERARRFGLRACQNVGQYWVDLISLPRRNMAAFEAEHLELVNGYHLEAMETPGPIVAVTAHTGNAELAVQALTFRGRAFVALVEPQEPPEWSQCLIDLRRSAGGRFYPADFSGVRASLEALREGHILGTMGDRDIQGSGICIELFGRKTKVPRGPWEMARRTNALVMPIFCTRKRNDDFRVKFEEPYRVHVSDDAECDVRRAAERYGRLLEAHLRSDPAQWAVLEDFWRVHACGTDGHGQS